MYQIYSVLLSFYLEHLSGKKVGEISMVILISLLSLSRAFALLPLFYISNVSADIALLIHGFNNNAMTWQQSGVSPYLHQQGWYDQGTLYDQWNSVVLQSSSFGTLSGQAEKNGNKLYTVNLASRAPVAYQSHQLRKIIHWLNQMHPAEPIFLIGHSIGGLVARFALIELFQEQPQKTKPNHISGLITIATPHLGTFRAAQAIDAVEVPFFFPGPGWRFLEDIFAGDSYKLVKKSKSLLYELYPTRPRNLTFWLNEQTHPQIPYFSVVRTSGDFLVPKYSQDMNNVPALKNRSLTWNSHSAHYLNLEDALTIHSILTLLSNSP